MKRSIGAETSAEVDEDERLPGAAGVVIADVPVADGTVAGRERAERERTAPRAQPQLVCVCGAQFARSARQAAKHLYAAALQGDTVEADTHAVHARTEGA